MEVQWCEEYFLTTLGNPLYQFGCTGANSQRYQQQNRSPCPAQYLYDLQSPDLECLERFVCVFVDLTEVNKDKSAASQLWASSMTQAHFPVK